MANNPAGEISLNLGITGPHYTLGAACAAGNAGIIQGVQMLRLGDCDIALCGGVSESIHTFGIFASFHSQGALAKHADPAKASRPFDRTATASWWPRGAACSCSNGSADARARGAKIYGEVVGYAMNSDATDFVLPDPDAPGRVHPPGAASGGDEPEDDRHRQHPRHEHDLRRRPGMPGPAAGLGPERPPHPVQQHQELHRPRDGRGRALELAGNLPAFDDGVCHATINLDRLDPAVRAARPGGQSAPRSRQRIDAILNNSFGMLGINSVVIVDECRRGLGRSRKRLIRF